jgi:hypothetical protein
MDPNFVVFYASVLSSQNKIRTFHGPHSEHVHPEQFLNASVQSLEFYIPANERVFLSENEHSLILSGLVANTIVISGKVNHVLLRKCSQLTLVLRDVTISGIDIINCATITLHTPIVNYVGLEFSQMIKIWGEVTDVSQVYLTGCLDVMLKDQYLPFNLSDTIVITKTGCYHKLAA